MPRLRTLTLVLLAALVLLAPLPTPARSAPGTPLNLSWLSDERSGVTAYTLSPDGRSVAYSTVSDVLDPYNLSNKSDLYLTATAGGAPRRLTPVQQGFPGIGTGKFSPDSRYLVYVLMSSDDMAGLYSVPVAGGESVRLSTDTRPFWITADSARVVFSNIYVTPIGGGTATRLYNGTVKALELTGDGRHAVFASYDNPPQLASVPLGGGPVTRLDQGDGVLRRALLAPDNKRIFYTHVSGQLYAVDVDGQRQTLLGISPELSDGALLATRTGYTVFFAQGSPQGRGVDLAAVADTGGKVRQYGVAEANRNLSVLSVAPGGRHVLFTTYDSMADPYRLYSVPVAGGRRVRLPGEGAMVVRTQRNGQLPLTPDGSRIVYIVNDPATGRGTLYSAQVANGKGVALVSQPLQNSVSDIRYALSPDGSLVAYAVPSGPNGFYEIFVVPVAGGKPTRVAGPFQYLGWDLDMLGFTPDSRSLLYIAGQDRPNILDLYIAPVR